MTTRRGVLLLLALAVFSLSTLAAANSIKCPFPGLVKPSAIEQAEHENPSAVVHVPILFNPKWGPHIGKKVTVDFGTDGSGKPDQLTQLVLSVDSVDPATAHSVRVLLANTYRWQRFRLFPVETGIWQLVTPRRAYHSKLFTSGERDGIKVADTENALKKLEEQFHQRTDKEELPTELVWFHTHPYRGENLSRADIREAERAAKKAFERFPSLQVFRIYAVPAKDNGQVLFRYSVYRDGRTTATKAPPDLAQAKP